MEKEKWIEIVVALLGLSWFGQLVNWLLNRRKNKIADQRDAYEFAMEVMGDKRSLYEQLEQARTEALEAKAEAAQARIEAAEYKQKYEALEAKLQAQESRYDMLLRKYKHIAEEIKKAPPGGEA